MKDRLLELSRINTRLHIKLENLKTTNNNLSTHVQRITSAKAFKLWQLLTKIKKNPSLLVKVIKVLVSEGPKGIKNKLKAKESQNNTLLSINDQYQIWFQKNYPDKKEILKQRSLQSKFFYRPLISIITPVYNPNQKWLRSCIESVIKQTYINWELCLVDDCSTEPHVKTILNEYSKKDKRIKIVFRSKNGHISKASNSALKLATGEFVALLDHDDDLAPHALFKVVEVLNKNKKLDFIYTDEDKVELNGQHIDPFFKPDWSPNLLTSFMYTGHLTIYRKELVNKVGRFRSKYNFSQDYDLALRISEITKKIYHIPEILYHWRTLPESSSAGGKPFARKSNIAALEDAVRRRGYQAKVHEYSYANKINYYLKKETLVSIIIPSDNKIHIKESIESINNNSTHKNTEIVVVTNSNLVNELQKKYRFIKFIKYDDKYSFSKKCNLGAKNAKGSFLIFFNDDVRIIEKQWIEELCGPLENNKNIGAVSPKLIYENKTIQYAGMVTNVRGIVGTAFHQKHSNSYEYFNLIQSVREVSILSGACFSIKKNLFEKIKGFDEINTPIMHSDIDLSFKIREKGLLIIYNPFSTLLHIGHQSLGKINDKKTKAYPDLFLLDKWGEYTSYDPYYPPTMRNLLYGHSDKLYRYIPPKKNLLRKPNKNLLFISHESSLTGAPLLISWLAIELLKHNIKVYFMVPKDGPLVDYLHDKNIPVFVDEEINTHIRGETQNFFKNFDLVLGNTILSFRPILASCKIGVKTAYYIHETPSYFNNDHSNKHLRGLDSNLDLIKTAFKNTNYIIYSNNLIKRIYNRIFGITKGNGLLPGIPRSVVSITKKDNNYFNIVHNGSIEPRKDQKTLILAYKELPLDIRRKIKITFIGKVVDKDYYKKLVNMYDKNIRFTKQISPAKVLGIYSKSDLYVMTSIEETGPLTILEAMKFKIPLISTPVGIVPQTIRNKVGGLITPIGDYKRLSKKIIFMYNNQSKAKRMAETAHKEFTSKFTIAKYTKNFMKITHL